MLCGYGCGKEVKFPSRKGMTKWCCSSTFSLCETIVKKTGYKKENHPNYGKKLSTELRKKISKSIKHVAKNNKEYIRKQSESRKYSLNDYRKKYPFAFMIEDAREHQETGEIQVRCKNHNCKNSKEKDGWFTPHLGHLYERIRQLEKDNGNGGGYLYCSDKCKKECPLFNVKTKIHNKIKIPSFYTDYEYNIWRTEVLKRDNNKCQYCNIEATHVHHIEPQKIQPGYTLDPVNGISACSKCHYKYGHKKGTECSTGALAQVICK